MLFFFVSGIIIESGEKYKIPFKDYAGKRLKTIAFPYLLWSAIGGLAHVLRYRTLNSVLSVGYYTLTLRGYSTLWFLPAIFFGELILYPILNSKHVKLVSAISVVVGIAAMVGLNYLQTFVAETFVDTTYDLIDAPIHTVFATCTAATLLLIGVWVYKLVLKNIDERNIVVLIVAMVVFIGCSFLTQFNENVSLNGARLGKIPPLYFATGIPMCVSLLIITRFLCSFTYKFPVLTWCGRNSLLIMCTHLPCYVLYAVQYIAKHIVERPTEESFQFYLYCFVVFIIVMVIEFVIVTVINKFFPWMTGKFKKKEKVADNNL